MKKFLMVVVLLIGIVNADGLAVKMKDVGANGIKMVTIPNTEVRTIQSMYTNDQYDLYVFLPSNYSKNVKYPLCVVPDAYFKFGWLSDVARNLQDGNMVKPFIVIGIDYGAGWGQPGNHRGRDLTFKKLENDTNTGGADNYIKFIRNEMLPLVKKYYPIDTNDMTYYGCSMGGTFGAYLMFQKDKIFKRFVLASPALCYFSNNLLELEEQYSKTNKALPIDLYLTMGSAEDKNYMVPCFYQFCGAIEKRDYAKLDYHMLIGYELTHATNDFGLYPKILMQIYGK
jgi:uncharacterized protein